MTSITGCRRLTMVLRVLCIGLLAGLDRIVKRERKQAVRDILAYLRTRTGDDLGKRPEAWIQRYSER